MFTVAAFAVVKKDARRTLANDVAVRIGEWESVSENRVFYPMFCFCDTKFSKVCCFFCFFFHTQQHPHSHISKQKYLVGKQKQKYVAGKTLFCLSRWFTQSRLHLDLVVRVWSIRLWTALRMKSTLHAYKIKKNRTLHESGKNIWNKTRHIQARIQDSSLGGE